MNRGRRPLPRASHRADAPVMGGRPRSWLGRTLGPMARGSLRGSIFTFMSAAIGPGALLLPYTFRLVGMPLGMLCLLFCSYTSAQSLRFIITIAHLTGCDSYSEGVAVVLGPTVGATISTVTNFVLLLATGSHLKFLTGLLQRLLPAQISEVMPLQMLAIAAVFPMCMRRDISYLRHVALVAPLTLLYVIVLILARGLAASSPLSDELGAHGSGSEGEVELLRFGDGGLGELPQAWAIMVNAMTCHHVAVPVYKELNCAKAQHVNKVVLRSIAYTSFMYALIGVIGFLSCGAATPENILLAYPREDNAAMAAQALVGCTLLVAIPLSVHALRTQVLAVLPPALGVAQQEPIVNVIFTMALLGLPSAVSCIFPSVSSIIGMACGFGMAVYMFLVPSFAILALRRLSGSSGLADMRPDKGSPFTGSASFMSGENLHELLLSSPLSSPLISPHRGGMVSPRNSCGDLVGLALEETSSSVCEILPPLVLEEAVVGTGETNATEASPLPVPPREWECGSEGSCGSSSPSLRQRCPPKSPKGDKHLAHSDDVVVAQWSTELVLALAALALGTVLGFAAAVDTLAQLSGA